MKKDKCELCGCSEFEQLTVKTNKKIMKDKSIKLSLEKAREIYNQTINEILAANFEKEQLENVITCWDDLGVDLPIPLQWGVGYDPYAAMYKLSQLMVHEQYNGEEQEYWCDYLDDNVKFAIGYRENKLEIYSYCTSKNFLTFKTEKKAKLFLKNHRDLIEQAKPLL